MLYLIKLKIMNLIRIESIKRSISRLKGKSFRIPCRNSYERYYWHQYAESISLPHRSIIDYTRTHINTKFSSLRNSGCCASCDGEQAIISPTPYSWVEINNGYDKLEIGNPEMIPQPRSEFIAGRNLTSVLKRVRREIYN